MTTDHHLPGASLSQLSAVHDTVAVVVAVLQSVPSTPLPGSPSLFSVASVDPLSQLVKGLDTRIQQDTFPPRQPFPWEVGTPAQLHDDSLLTIAVFLCFRKLFPKGKSPAVYIFQSAISHALSACVLRLCRALPL